MALYLGLDLSTQSFKAEIIDTQNPDRSFTSFSVNFGKDLPEYESPEGFRLNDDPLIREADPAMWLDALDILFRRMKEAGIPLSEIAGISGSGQQHGTVYLQESFFKCYRGS